MKNLAKVLKALSLCFALLMIAVIAQGTPHVMGLSFTAPIPTSVIYGNSITYKLSITTNGGGSSPYNLTISGLPSNVVYSPTSVTITGGVSSSVDLIISNCNNSNPAKYIAVNNKYTFTVSLDGKTVTGSYSITPKALSVTGTFTPQNKTYDGTTNATVSESGLNWTGLLAGDVVSLAYNFANKNIGTGKTITCSLTGTDAGNYSLSPLSTSLTANITTKPLSVTGTITTQNKPYDGNTIATVTESNVSLSGKVAGDVLYLAYNFDNKNVGTGKPITCTLTGTDAPNYSFTPPSLTSRDITTKPLSVSGAMVTSKEYDGSTTAKVNGGALSGLVSGDENYVFLNNTGFGTFSDKNVANNKTVTTNFTITGSGINNYSFTSTSCTGNITAKALTVTNPTVTSKDYDGSLSATITGTLAGVVGSDDVKFNGTGTFADKNIGTKAVTSTSTISGTDAGNYTLTQPTGLTGTITAKTLTVTNPTVTSKVYNGLLSATITGTLAGVIGSENVIFNGTGTFADKNIGTGISVTSNCTISGTDAGNYTLTQPTGLTGTITAKTLTITGITVATKEYDGTTAATLSGGSLQGVISPDVVDLTQAGTFSSPNIGTGISVTSNCSISGTDAGNYSLTQPVDLKGDIIAPTAVAWSGTTSTDWNTAGNWTPPYLPTATVDVSIANGQPVIGAATEAACNNLIIASSGGLTIQPGGSLTVNNNITNNNSTVDGAGLSLLSDDANTGSLIVKGKELGSGLAQVVRYMSPNTWHLVSSPLSEQTISTFLSGNSNIPYNKAAGAPTVYPLERAMRAYDGLQLSGWGEFIKEDSQEKMTTGKGYSIRVKGASGTQRVTFIGKVQPEAHTVDVTPAVWNCVGNPYTSAINISGTNSFLSANSSKMHEAFQCVYVWDAAADAYAQINSTGTGQLVQQGQAFMIAMASANATVSFSPVMQAHQTNLALKSTEDTWPSIQLTASGDSINSSTMVAFHEGMTPGLDPSYDAGLLSAGGPELYTRLVDDYGIPFDIQALPANQYDQLIIPVGVDYAKGGEVTFSAKGMYLPSSCSPILEDRQLGILTNLNDRTYTADLTAHTAGTGRFYLHTSYSSTWTASHNSAAALSAWMNGHHEINIKGQINNGAVASLFDLQGRLILTRVLREGTSELISLPAVKRGIYLLQVRDSQQTQTMKVSIGE